MGHWQKPHTEGGGGGEGFVWGGGGGVEDDEAEGGVGGEEGWVPCYCLGLVEIVWGGEGGGP